METIIVRNVPQSKLEFYRQLALDLGGQMTSVANEPDGEFTIVIVVPAN